MSNSDDFLIKVENVSKKFCRSLKRSMLYGIEDIARDFLHLKNTSNQLRTEEFWAVDKVSFEVKRGECLGIIGRNGAGKSTLLKMLNGIYMPDKGKITIKGKVGALIEVGAGFHPMLTGRENIYVNGAILGMSNREIDKKFDEIVAFAELEEFLDMPVKHYSSGMYVRLGFAIATTLSLDLLILDEILAVGDIKFRMKCYQKISDIIKSGVSVILVSHSTLDIKRICNLGIVLDKGINQYTGIADKAIIEYESIIMKSGFVNGQSKGNVTFQSIKIFDDNKKLTHEVKTHERVSIVVMLKVNRIIRGARIGFHIDAPIGRLSSISTLYDGIDLDLKPPIVKIEFFMPELVLLFGNYSIYFDVYGPSPSDFEAVSAPVNLRVIGPPTDGLGYSLCHHIFLKHKWILS